MRPEKRSLLKATAISLALAISAVIPGDPGEAQRIGRRTKVAGEIAMRSKEARRRYEEQFRTLKERQADEARRLEMLRLGVEPDQYALLQRMARESTERQLAESQMVGEVIRDYELRELQRNPFFPPMGVDLWLDVHKEVKQGTGKQAFSRPAIEAALASVLSRPRRSHQPRDRPNLGGQLEPGIHFVKPSEPLPNFSKIASDWWSSLADIRLDTARTDIVALLTPSSRRASSRLAHLLAQQNHSLLVIIGPKNRSSLIARNGEPIWIPAVSRMARQYGVDVLLLASFASPGLDQDASSKALVQATRTALATKPTPLDMQALLRLLARGRYQLELDLKPSQKETLLGRDSTRHTIVIREKGNGSEVGEMEFHSHGAECVETPEHPCPGN